ncbi:hypothetical protein CEXT_448651 [Caerostris extrusa]|uniref:Uncharacterized protein n=1 Tax=Caerostris extrusa TaxID=172846 RepID=A0AAV4VGE8_CAEEX|nr:hypothetical protein CEXT_448651 [Caerostris extrusa]
MLSESSKIEFQVTMHWKTDLSEDSYPSSVFPPSILGIYSRNAGNGNHELQSRTIRKQEGKGGFPLPFISVLLGVGKVHGGLLNQWQTCVKLHAYNIFCSAGDEDQECAGKSGA